MKRFLSYIFCAIALCFSSALYAQVEEIIVPYECGFEDSIEVSGWVLNVGNDGPKCQDQWMIGNLDYHGGRQSLYVSCDTGKTTNYGANPNVVVAYKKVRIPDITADTKCGLDISFDWRCMGDVGKTGLHFFFVPVNRMQTKFLNSLHTTGALPSGLSRPDASLYANYDWVTWISPKDKYIVPEEAEYYMIFVWQNSNLDKNKYQPFAACIDNLQISLTQVPRPTDLNGTSSNDTIWFNWGGSALNYDVQYRKSGKKWLALATLQADEKQNNSVMLTDMEEGLYEIRVRGRNSNDPKDCSCWITITVICYIPDNHCIDFVNLDREGVICQIGTLAEASGKTTDDLHNTGRGQSGCGPLSYGETAISSRHQVNWTQNLFDPRTGNRLRTIPYGGLASVRLGNWDVFYETESIEFEYLVDTADAKIILLKYAIVLEAPGHGEQEDPFFKLEVLDENNRFLDAKCGNFDFTPENKEIQWFSSGAYVWKDWTSIGMNISQYHGQLIKIRLLTRDCRRGGHAGYAYFTLDCLDAAIKSTSCGESISIEMEAPDGFAYIWTKRSNPDSVISTRQVLQVPSNDTATYDCRVEYIGIEGCGFNLFTSIVPRFPYPDFEWQWIPSDCENKIALINKSCVKTKVAGEFAESHEKLEYSYWTVEGENWYSSKMDTAIYTVKNEGDTVLMNLEVGLAGGACSEDSTIQIIVPPIHGHLDTIYRELCAGQYIVFNKEFIAKSGVYTEVLKNIWGCDSVTVMVLNVLPEIEDTHIYDTICSNEVLKLWGEKYTESGTYNKLLYSKKGCDSVVILNLEVIDPLGIVVDDTKQTICADEESLTVGFDFVDTLRAPVYYSVVFDSFAQQYGFVDQNNIEIPYDTEELHIAIPDNCRPNSYSATFVFTDTTKVCGDISVPVTFDVYYSSSILEAKFNNLVTVLNEEHNGGYAFVEDAYKWYRNGSLVEGDTISYLYLGENNSFGAGDCFYVVVKRVDDGVEMRSCEICPGTVPVEDVIETPDYLPITLFKGGAPIVFENVEDGVVSIYSVTGQLVSEAKVSLDMSQVSAPMQAGTYILRLSTDGYNAVYKIQVR